MKTFTFVFGLLLIPSFAFAAPLTNEQATSLISVVQSSPTTPASAFTNLITAFSSITIPQAESLINVVQQAVGVPADAFVSMLLAFTVDPAPVVTPVENPPASLGSTNPAPAQAPVVQLPVMKELDVSIPRTGRGEPSEVIEIHYKENGKEIVGVPVTITLSQGTFLITGQVGRDSGAGTRVNTITVPNGEHGIRKGYQTTGIKYNAYDAEMVASGAFYPGATITVTANDITKTTQGRDIFKLK